MKAKSESTSKKSKKVSAAGKTTTVKKAVTKVVKKTAGPTESEIRVKAEELYRERTAKNIPGTQESDWLKAEKILKGLK
jgi:hypothetical protein